MSSADFHQAAALELALDCDGRFAHITYLDRSCDKVYYEYLLLFWDFTNYAVAS